MDKRVKEKFKSKGEIEAAKESFLELVKTPEQVYYFRNPADQLDLTDLSFAEFFVFKYGDRIKYNNQAGKWYIWENDIWIECNKNTNELHQLVKDCIKEMFRIAIDQTDKDERNNFLNFCKKCESRNNIDNMLSLASRERAVNRNESDFDKFPEYFNCKNVLIDLSGNTFKIIKRDPELLIRQTTNIEYNPASKCPKFLEILDTIFNSNIEMINFIQRAVGYSLTGFTSEDCLFFMYGLGRNGKSTFAEILKLLFGNYYHKANIELLMIQKNVSVRNDIADLKGKRLVITSEIEQGKRFAESLLKDLTGGDDITARHLFQEHFTFKPVFKLWIYGNHKPIIKGTDEGIKRRIKLIPFTNIIPEDQIRSRNSIMIEMRAEVSGILNWALEGFNKWRENGKLIFPDEVKEATKEYFNEMDNIQNFVNDCIKSDPGKLTSNKDLYDRYKAYAEENGDIILSKRNLSKALKEKGFSDRRGTGGLYNWKDITLLVNSENTKNS